MRLSYIIKTQIFHIYFYILLLIDKDINANIFIFVAKCNPNAHFIRDDLTLYIEQVIKK